MLSGWGKSTNIQLYSTTALTDYQVKFIVYRSNGVNTADNIYIGANCETDYRDLRFTSTTDTLYSYWIESSDSASATIWVKIPSIAANAYTDIVLQYGNSGASAVSSGDDTFEFFDDFSSGSVDSSKWTITGTPVITSGTVRLTGSQEIVGKTSFGVGYSLYTRAALFNPSGSGNYAAIVFNQSPGMVYIDSNNGYTGLQQILSYNGTSASASTITTNTSTYVYRIEKISASSCKYYRDSTLLGEKTVYLNTGSGAAKFSSLGSGYVDIDYVFVKVYSAIEPTKYYPQPLTNWTYKQSHVITLPTTDYQVMFTLNYGTGTSTGSTIYLNGHANADFGDVRFTDNNGVEIPYWIETYTAATTATVWVKIPTTSTIWIYYGNSDAQTTSNGETTFVFFDDFTGTSLNTSKWSSTLITYNSGTGTISVNNALTLTQTNGADRGVSLRSANALSSDTLTIRTKVNARSAGTSGAQIRLVLNNSSNTDAGVFGLYTPNNGTSYLYNGFGVGNPSFADTFTISSPTIYEWEGRVTNPRAYKDGVLKCTGSGTPTAPAGNYIRIWTYSTTASITLDWICARSYATTEPTHSTWGEEQEVTSYPLKITINPTSGTDPLSVSYNLSIGDALDDFVLNFGDGQEYTGDDITSFATTHTYNTPGTYTVWAEGYTEFATHRYYEIPYGVNVSAPAVDATFTTSQTYNIIQFTNTSTGDPNEFFWTFGDGNVSYEQNPSHTYHSAATHLVTLYASNQYQYDVATTNITITQILTPPEAYFAPNNLNLINPTLPYTVQFTNYSIPAFGCTYNWVIDSTSYTTEDPSHSFATYGYYDVSLTVTNALGSSTKSYNDAIKISRKGKTLFEVVGCADIFSTFGVEVFDEVATYVDLGIVYATILPESICFVQSEIPDVPGIDEWGIRHLYSTINEWGHRIFTTLNSWGHRIMHNASATDHSPLAVFNAEIFEERIIMTDEHQFGTE